MPYTVTQKDILDIRADAAVLCVENRMIPALSAAALRLAEAGGAAFRSRIRELKFLPVGSAVSAGMGIDPFRQIILTAAPRWENAQGNEILILHLCYRAVFREAEALGCKSLAMPFLSAFYYRFPLDDAVRVALREAEKTGLNVCYVAENREIYDCSQKSHVKPEISSYIGYYRDYAVFQLENGQFIRVDVRPEKKEAARILYFEPCYRVGHDPEQIPLSEKEIERLKEIYYETEL